MYCPTGYAIALASRLPRARGYVTCTVVHTVGRNCSSIYSLAPPSLRTMTGLRAEASHLAMPSIWPCHQDHIDRWLLHCGEPWGSACASCEHPPLTSICWLVCSTVQYSTSPKGTICKVIVQVAATLGAGRGKVLATGQGTPSPECGRATRQH